jgi:hypothetical protein
LDRNQAENSRKEMKVKHCLISTLFREDPSPVYVVQHQMKEQFMEDASVAMLREEAVVYLVWLSKPSAIGLAESLRRGFPNKKQLCYP